MDVIKIDVDTSWRQLGVEQLFEKRVFRVMVIEVDGSWGGVDSTWNVSQVDQLAWFARVHGYDSYLKIPCKAREGAGSVELGSWQWDYKRRKYYKSRKGTHAAYLFQLGSRNGIRLTNYHAHRPNGVQDMLLMDSSDPSLRELPALLEKDCFNVRTETTGNTGETKRGG